LIFICSPQREKVLKCGTGISRYGRAKSQQQSKHNGNLGLKAVESYVNRAARGRKLAVVHLYHFKARDWAENL